MSRQVARYKLEMSTLSQRRHSRAWLFKASNGGLGPGSLGQGFLGQCSLGQCSLGQCSRVQDTKPFEL